MPWQGSCRGEARSGGPEFARQSRRGGAAQRRWISTSSAPARSRTSRMMSSVPIPWPPPVPKQPQEIGDRAPILANSCGDLLMRPAKLFGHHQIGPRFINRIEVFSLEVLDKGNLKTIYIANIDENNRNFFHSYALRRTKSPLAGDELISVPDSPHQEGFQDPPSLDGANELLHLLRVVGPPRLPGVRKDLIHGCHPPFQGWCRSLLLRRPRNQGFQSPTQSFSGHLP